MITFQFSVSIRYHYGEGSFISRAYVLKIYRRFFVIIIFLIDGAVSHGIDMLRIISDCSAALATPKIKYFRGAGFAIQYANFLLLSEVSSLLAL